MPELLLLRHAKARWAAPGQRDFDRALDSSGIEDARRLGAHLRRNGVKIARIAASAATRSRQTVEAMALDGTSTTYLRDLYEATPAQALDIIRQQADGDSLLIVGHNPVMEELAIALVRDGDMDDRLRSGFPTCALAIIGLSTALAAIEPGTGRLETFISPVDLK